MSAIFFKVESFLEVERETSLLTQCEIGEKTTMGMSQALADKIASAKTSTGGNPIKDGEGVLVIKRILCEDKYKGTFFIPEFDVVESRKTHSTIEPNAVGSDCSCAWDVGGSGKKGDAARGNIKQFICGLFGLEGDSTDISGTILKVSGPAGSKESLIARGMRVRYATYRKVIQSGDNAGKEGCYPKFSVFDQTDEDIAEWRAKLDATKR